ncbi:hypothetical protein CBR_g31506 [Chara braunii]|uniref:OCRE domain-containing protein n=1 Tax=Chara braunii TaxID=69332 RepID=A0A388LF59_CHABU|nr:hypothetical protein CBR_g31506 [Chara braunii]|eukprot:GBG80949.1 hypothetical protein CBR_g31506 [Chara braunii]
MEAGRKSTAGKHPLIELDPDEQEKEKEKVGMKKPLFPKGKKLKAKQDVMDAFEEELGPIKLSDPRLAAKQRALSRKEKEANIDSRDVAGPGALAVGEEEFEGDEGVDDEGTVFEPFNLRQERKEGFFDDAGNYVEYRWEAEAKDAWLETAEVDTKYAEKAAAKAAAYAKMEEESEGELSTAELAGIKRRISDALQPGESVLDALRRLGGGPRSQGAGRGRGGGQVGRGHGADRMSPANKVLFDQLTEDAMKLLQNGELGVYSDHKETFQREAEGYEALQRIRAGGKTEQGNNVAIRSSGTEIELAKTETTRSQTNDDRSADAHAKDVNDRGAKTAEATVSPSAANPSMDMFADSDDEAEQATGVGNKNDDDATTSSAKGGVVDEKAPGPESLGTSESSVDGRRGGGAFPEDGSGYVYDESTGYYYNAELGYYYDAKTGLYGSSILGTWYHYDETTQNYVEVGGALGGSE